MSVLLFLLGDQLDHRQQALQQLDKKRDHILMAELADEAGYVPHNKTKIALIFSAMRHFAAALQAKGYNVIYFTFSQSKEAGLNSVNRLIDHQLQQQRYTEFHYIEPGEHRLSKALIAVENTLQIPVKSFCGGQFMFSKIQMLNWFSGKKKPRMEHFYRWARQRTGLLMDANQPIGGQYNFDKQNRQPWRNDILVPAPTPFLPDGITAQVLSQVEDAFADHPGTLENFALAVTASQAECALHDFIQHRLPRFGEFQDALADNQTTLFHSLLSAYINIGLLSPLQVCRAAVEAYEQQQAPINAVEGFVRQILGWREYVRGLYWFFGPGYAEHNALDARRPLPQWFWTGKTRMRCVSQAINSSLNQGYAYHIQRLMVIGNFALLSGLDVKAVCRWYLAVYVDAFEWVELPNTLGMALYADNGLVASKPYAASGRYINKMGDHCQRCVYKVNQQSGHKACPFNALYWHFIQQHQQKFADNPRMALMLSQWKKKPPRDQRALIDWARFLLVEPEQL